MTSRWAEQLATEYRRIEATPLPETVPGLLERAARRYGDSAALDFFEGGGGALSYVELRERVLRLACSLHALGVRHGSHVAVAMPNRIEFPVTWLALAELGAVMVPIGPSVESNVARGISLREGRIRLAGPRSTPGRGGSPLPD